ncbi:hypothetical protein U9M48_022049 [Paspalum notatum var. saurae]|uniref:Uncharacterized protein n=1 Tax=Paspalum notatum var. saurae TaxID=547442 RepID=A0AAQ3TJ17_PASNO
MATGEAVVCCSSAGDLTPICSGRRRRGMRHRRRWPDDGGSLASCPAPLLAASEHSHSSGFRENFGSKWMENFPTATGSWEGGGEGARLRSPGPDVPPPAPLPPPPAALLLPAPRASARPHHFASSQLPRDGGEQHAAAGVGPCRGVRERRDAGIERSTQPRQPAAASAGPTMGKGAAAPGPMPAVARQKNMAAMEPSSLMSMTHSSWPQSSSATST